VSDVGHLNDGRLPGYTRIGMGSPTLTRSFDGFLCLYSFFGLSYGILWLPVVFCAPYLSDPKRERCKLMIVDARSCKKM